MPSPATAYSHEERPFPARFASSDDGRPAYSIFESFAKEETVVLVEAYLEWSMSDGGGPMDAVFDVVSAYADDPDRVNPSTSMGSVRLPHGTFRRFLVGVPGGHKLVVYPAQPDRAGAIEAGVGDSFLRTVIVDYWA